MMNLSGKISVIIPTFNSEKYIRECLTSVLNQTYQNIEVIVINDGSTDLTLSIVSEIQKIDSRVKIINQANSGVSVARNKGLDFATGDYIVFLDSDDWLEIECLEKSLAQLVDNDADFVIYEFHKEFEGGRKAHYTYKENFKLYNSNASNNDFFLYDMRTITVWGKLFTKDIIGSVRFDEKMVAAEDVDFCFQIYNKTKKAVYIKMPLMHYRIIDTSTIHRYDPNIQKKFNYSLSTIKDKMDLNNSLMKSAYYSLEAISFMVIIQNQIYLNSSMSIKQKSQAIKNLKIEFELLFDNLNVVKVPFSRMIFIHLVNLNLNYFVMLILYFKRKRECSI